MHNKVICGEVRISFVHMKQMKKTIIIFERI